MRIKKRANGEGTLYYSEKLKKWVGQVSIGYKKRKTVYGNKESEVRNKIKEIINKLDTTGYIDNTKLSLGMFLNDWFNLYILNSNLKETTKINYKTYITKHIIPEIGNILLKDLDVEKLQKFYNKKLLEGSIRRFKQVDTGSKIGLSAKTIRNINNMLSQALQKAIIDNLVYRNVAQLVKLPTVKKQPIEIFTMEEVNRIISIAKQDRYGLIIILALVTGLREGEISALLWNDIDLNTGCININKTLNRINDIYTNTTKINITETKTESSKRTVYVSAEMLELLKQLKCSFPFNSDQDYIFSTTARTAFEPRNIQRKHRSILKAAGVKYRKFHALRHTFATNCIYNKTDIKVLSKILGHANVKITMDLYVHPSELMKEDAMKKVASNIFL